MKKGIAIGLILAFALAAFVACGNKNDEGTLPEDGVSTETTENGTTKDDKGVVEDMEEELDKVLDDGEKEKDKIEDDVKSKETTTDNANE